MTTTDWSGDKCPEGCQFTRCGIRDGMEISAVTDAAGPQVIVQGDGIHLLSKPLENHEEAIKLGNQVMAEGVDCYEHWSNLATCNLFDSLWNIFGFQLTQQRKKRDKESESSQKTEIHK